MQYLNGINNKNQKFKEQSTVSDTDVKNDFNLRIKLLKENLKKHWKF